MKTQIVRTLLEGLGYSFVLKEGEWVRCAISGHGEQWLGKGLDEETAIQDACNTMFPSKAARDFLEQQAEGLGHEARIENPTAQSLEPESVVASEPELESTPEPEPEPIVASEPEPEPEPEPKPRRIVVVAPEPVAYVSPEEDEDDEPEMSPEEALELIQAIQDEMDDGREDVAQMNPQYQRVHMSAWIFRARAVEEKFPKDKEIQEAVHRVARRLTDWCKILWPGSIRALQVYTQPSQALDGLIRYKNRPQNWADAAAQIEDHIEDGLWESGNDEFGWKDGALCQPEAPNPGAVLKEAVKKIEAAIGPLGGPLDEKRKEVSASKIDSHIEELILAAHLLRWTRRKADPVQWGIAMGALRWASRQGRAKSPDNFQNLLSAHYKPAQSWASLLGRDPEVNRKNAMRKKVMSALPNKDWLEEDLLDWLKNAFHVFNNPQIAKLGDAVRDEILELTNADFADADRHARSRLRKLQSILRNRGVDMSRVELPTEEELAGGDETDEEEKTATVKDATEVILEKVQKITKGKNILFVTNRPEQKLHRDLERDLQAKVDYRVGDTARTMKPIIKSVDRDRYDMVLMATGFNNHSADTALCRATKSEGIPYIRVQKGRLASTIRAIGRAFNVSAQGKHANDSSVARVG